ncbi:MAG: hypothetical protein QOD92_169 [Acidimicrobiaceae bacterium]|jgi:hypothetical protein
MRFVPYPELDGVPNVIVDGDGAPSTVLTLSHWPGSHVPPSLAADLSAEIVVRYLEQPELHVDVDAVSNNHLDEDGLVGVWAMVEPEQALLQRDLVVDVARAGDFGWSKQRDAARVAFAVGALVDQRPLTGDYASYCAERYQELLPLVPNLLADPAAFGELWREEESFLDASNEAIDRGDVTIVEHRELDLAIVTLPEQLPSRPFHRFTQPRSGPLHPMAVFNRTERTRVAYVCGHRYVVELRYESVVQFVSRPILRRPDLGVLAERLNEFEASGGKWQFEGVGGLTPFLKITEAESSSLDRDLFLDELTTFLAAAEPAWDPWQEEGFR